MKRIVRAQFSRGRTGPMLVLGKNSQITKGGFIAVDKDLRERPVGSDGESYQPPGNWMFSMSDLLATVSPVNGSSRRKN